MLDGCFQAVVDAVLAIAKPNEPIDLFMVEIMEMRHKTDSDTQYVSLPSHKHLVTLFIYPSI